MHIRRFFAALISASVAWGGFVLADQPAAYAICSDPCGGGGGYDPAVHAYVDVMVQGINATSSVGSLTGGHLSAACTSACTDSWSDTLTTEEGHETYTVTPASGWAVDFWLGCDTDPGTATSCTMTPAYSTSITKTSDNSAHVAVYLRDAVSPTVSITGGPADGSAISNSAIFSFTANGTGTAVTTSCAIDNGTYSRCTSPWSTGALAEGAHTFTVRATDGGDNAVSTTRHFTVDRTPPTVSITSGPAAGSYNYTPSATFSFTASDTNFDHADCGDAATDSSNVALNHPNCITRFTNGPLQLSGLPEGVHTFVIRAYDTVGNFSQISRTWYVDTVPPTATFTGGPEDGSTTSDRSPTFDFTPDGTGSAVTTTCQLDGPVSVAQSACTTDSSEALSGLTNGAYTFTLVLTDEAGNLNTVTRHFNVDTSIPTLTVDSGPEAGSYLDTGSATFTFTAGNGATSVYCSYDGETQRPCTGGATSDALTGMTDGTHTWTVRAVNSAGTPITVTRSFTVDTTDPTAAFTTGPADGERTNDAAPEFAWTADGTGSPVTVTCRLDGTTGDCTSPTSDELPTLSDAVHTLTVDVTDATGHSVEISRTFTVDTTPPTVQIPSGPSDGDAVATHDVTYYFSSEANTSYQCATDDAPLGPCAGSGNDDLSGLSDGVHTWHLTATDTAGNVTTIDRSFTVDTAAPTAAFTSGVADNGFTNDTTPELDFAVDGTGTDASSTCSIDSGDAAPCTSPASYVMPSLAQGTHTAHVTVTDAAGNTVTISRTFTVDTTAPALTVLSGPAQNGATNQTSVTFGFSAENGTSLACSLDGGAYVLCTGTGSDTTTGLTAGKHTWSVRATDPAGNHTVVSRAFTVDLTKPSVTGTTSWPMFSLGKTLTYSWTPTDAGSGIASSDVQVRHAGPSSSGYTAWSSPSTWTATTARKVSLNATRGYTYCFHVRTRDRAGNTSSWSATRCTTLPIDDVSLKRSSGWKKVTGTSFYAHTATQTTRHNATLTSGTVHARHVAIVATTCKGCGMVGVYRGSTLLKKISLAATKTHHRVLLIAWSGSSAKTGAIRIKVLSASGHLVQIDGLAVTLR